MQVLILSDSDYRIAVGHRLRRLIKACRLKQVDAAEAMGVTRNHLGNWLRGDAYPNPYAIYKFCRSHGVNTDYIYLGDYSGLPKWIGDAVEKAELAQAGLSELDHQQDEN
ncbi:DNA-binding helix-turn-helix protein [Acetobacteraceae bacterium AT-5844]|nr:DNA-binding helix-turn-helix protein [Acetobacteraceae bacterium AT-5844]